MKTRSIGLAAASPFSAWIGLALKTGEMLAASAQVIHHRTGRMAMAGMAPNARDRREFTLMGQEKLEAAAESALAMAMRMATINQQFGMLLFGQMMGAATGWMALAASRTALQSGQRQAQLLRRTATDASKAASQFSHSMASLAQHGLKPVHSRATGNAKRLLKT